MTSVPAKEFHLNDRGEIAPGKRANLLLVKGDPTHDITATRDIVTVWKAGVEDDRDAWRAMVAKANQAAEALKTAPVESVAIRLRIIRNCKVSHFGCQGLSSVRTSFC